jgi:glyceraldehyde 3-phosphate dehydrogenase
LLLNHPTIEVVAINDIADNKTMAHLLKYDSIWCFTLKFPDDMVLRRGKTFSFFIRKNIANLDWKRSLIYDYVIEATGKYKPLRI